MFCLPKTRLASDLFAPGRTRGLGRTRENLPKAGDVKNDTAGL